MSDVPTFVVVGNVNQGKSSVVATLSEDPSVPIASSPGTTVRSGEYEFVSGDRVLFRLVDTPGFQEARAALAWMTARSTSAGDHPATVRAFVEAHRDEPRFEEEVRLLEPILDGASVLYTVDGSAAPQPSNEAEMEILRWTGVPGMALINHTRERSEETDWRPLLEQFFNVVRTFNAQAAGFEERIGLLQGFRELREDWRDQLDEAIEAMREERRHRRDRAAAVVAELLVAALTHVERRRLREEEASREDRAALEKAYLASLRKLEDGARSEIERLYRHTRLQREGDALGPHEEDLFSETSWLAFGLTRAQLARRGAVWGGSIGATIDAFVGGISILAGLVIGTAVGGATGFFVGTKVARAWGTNSKLARILFPGDNGRYLAMGPVRSPRFAWMLLDRALVHHRVVRDRAHARRDALPAAPAEGEKRGIVAGLDGAFRARLDAELRRVLKKRLKGSASSDAEARIRDRLAEVM